MERRLHHAQDVESDNPRFAMERPRQRCLWPAWLHNTLAAITRRNCQRTDTRVAPASKNSGNGPPPMRSDLSTSLLPLALADNARSPGPSAHPLLPLDRREGRDMSDKVQSRRDLPVGARRLAPGGAVVPIWSSGISGNG
jgi:hypothetical protein